MSGKRANGEGSIYKRADGRWGASVFVDTVDGMRKRIHIYGATRQEVHDHVHGHEKVLGGGRVEVPAGGQIKVPIPRSSCRPGVMALSGDGDGANQSPHRPGDSIEVCEGSDGHHFRLPRGG
jgi:hypothetical protein